MKKIIILTVIAMCATLANAQTLVEATAKKVHRAISLDGTSTIDQAITWGYYLGEEGYMATGLQGMHDGDYAVAMFVPANDMLKGAKISGINVPAYAQSVSNIKVWVASSLEGEHLADGTFSGIYNPDGYNSVELDKTVEIAGEGLYVCYSFSLALNTLYDPYPFGVVSSETEGAFYVQQGDDVWVDMSNLGYASAMQIFVDRLNISANAANLVSAECHPVVTGGKAKAIVKVYSNSNNGVKQLGYRLVVDGKETTSTLELPIPIKGGLEKNGVADIEFDAPEGFDIHNATLDITSVNGEQNEMESQQVAFNFLTVSRAEQRITVVEEFTGTGCGNCPRGWLGMEAIKEDASDVAIGISWHKFNSNDAMYQSRYADLGMDSAPMCTVDRRVYADPYYGENREGIIDCVAKYSEWLPTVSISANAHYADDDNKTIAVEAETEFLTNASGYNIAFAITADGLHGDNMSWLQENYYAPFEAESFADAALAQFGKGGIYGQALIALVYNDVLIGSTYDRYGRTQVAPFEGEQKAGDKQKSTYTLNMPTSSMLLSAIDFDKVYLNVIVTDQSGEVANAFRVKVTGGTGTSDSGTIKPQAEVKVSPISQQSLVMGETMSPNTKYVAGANYATFAPVVWNTETNEVKDYADLEEGAFHGVNNSGTVVGDDGKYPVAFRADGTPINLYCNKWTELNPDGEAGGAAWAVSEDGNTILGSYYNADWTTMVCTWNAEGERTDLRKPSTLEAGFVYDYAMARWITPDASVILGMLVDHYSTWPACIWRRNAQGGYDSDVICKEYWGENYADGKPFLLFSPTGISENGEWVALQVLEAFDDNDPEAHIPSVKAARMNLKTRKVEVVPVENDDNMLTSAIANDGTLLYLTGAADFMGRIGYVWPAGSSNVINLNEMLLEAPGMIPLTGNSPCAITGDGHYIEGFAVTNEMVIASYILDFSKYQADGIIDVTTHNMPADATKAFNLQGMKLNDAYTKGITIKGGKKYLNR